MGTFDNHQIAYEIFKMEDNEFVQLMKASEIPESVYKYAFLQGYKRAAELSEQVSEYEKQIIEILKD